MPNDSFFTYKKSLAVPLVGGQRNFYSFSTARVTTARRHCLRSSKTRWDGGMRWTGTGRQPDDSSKGGALEQCRQRGPSSETASAQSEERTKPVRIDKVYDAPAAITV